MTTRWRNALLLSAALAVRPYISDAAVHGPVVSDLMRNIHPAQFAPIPESGFMLPPVPMGDLRLSGDCETSLPVFGYPDREYWPAHGGITMSNDGGWCWIQFSQTYLAVLSTPDVTIIEQPGHGRITVEKMKDRVSVAYQPSAGFAGADHFALRTDGPVPNNIPFAVTVR